MPTNPSTPTTPGADLDPDKMPGHWLLARMGKRVLRPGGRELTQAVLAEFAITGDDDVVELAPGLGATARLILDRSPASYTGVERDEAAAASVGDLLRGGRDEVRVAAAQHTGLDDLSADVVVGEAFLTMQTEANKQQIVDEAFRVLRPGGRYGLHELCLRPDGLDDATQEQLRGDLSRSIRVGARPLTAPDWRALLERAGFVVQFERTVEMRLLEPRRLIDDEGLARAIRIAVNVVRTPAARRRVRAMRATFHEHRRHLGAIGLVAIKPTPQAGSGVGEAPE
jgi:SAM-dependent methyltransferase